MKPDTVKLSVKKPDCEREGTTEILSTEEFTAKMLQLNPLQKHTMLAFIGDLATLGDQKIYDVEDDHGVQFFDESGKLWGTMTLKDKKAPIWQKADAPD